MPTVFLDRDGVINERLLNDYVGHADQFRILPGATTAIKRLNQNGFRTVVITNQRGIAIGKTSRDMVNAIHRLLRDEVARAGGTLEEYYLCPHDRHEGCTCRKPEAGLLDQAHRKQPVLWAQSYLVGDCDTDILAGLKRQVCTIKVAGPSKVGAHFECTDLSRAVDFILSHHAP